MGKRGPAKGNKASKRSGAKGGKSRPSLKKGKSKIGARHGKRAKKK